MKENPPRELISQKDSFAAHYSDVCIVVGCVGPISNVSVRRVASRQSYEERAEDSIPADQTAKNVGGIVGGNQNIHKKTL